MCIFVFREADCVLTFISPMSDVSGPKSRVFVWPTPKLNNAVIDRRLHHRCCHLGSYFKPLKGTCSPVRPLAYRWYYCEQFIAKSKAARALRFS